MADAVAMVHGSQLEPANQPMPVPVARATTGLDIPAFLARFRAALAGQISESGKQSVSQAYGETALALLEAIASHDGETVNPWHTIATLPLSGEPVWLRRGAVVDGPRPAAPYDFDSYTSWAPCLPPQGGSGHE